MNNCDPYCGNLLAAALWHGEPVSALCQDPGKIWLQFSFLFVSVQTEAARSNDGIHHSSRCHNTRREPLKFWHMNVLEKQKDARNSQEPSSASHLHQLLFFLSNMHSWSCIKENLIQRGEVIVPTIAIGDVSSTQCGFCCCRGQSRFYYITLMSTLWWV